MTTSGTSAFNLDLNNIIEEAFERCGAELRTGYDMRTARRSLNLLTIEWASRGINLWTIEQGQINMNQNQAMYALPNDTIDLLDQVVRTSSGNASNQTDINITRISESTYATIPNKLTTGRPIQVWINRQSGQSNTSGALTTGAITSSSTSINVDNINLLAGAGFIRLDNEVISYNTVTQTSPSSTAGVLSNLGRGQQGTAPASHNTGSSVIVTNVPSINVWPTPDQGTTAAPYYTFVYWRMRRIQDAGGNGTFNQDIPFRLLPCLVAGLAFYLAQKLPEGQQRLQFLKQEYEEQWLIASTEDREKAPLRFVPRNTNYYR
jgi:hypothetical protein